MAFCRISCVKGTAAASVDPLAHILGAENMQPASAHRHPRHSEPVAGRGNAERRQGLTIRAGTRLRIVCKATNVVRTNCVLLAEYSSCGVKKHSQNISKESPTGFASETKSFPSLFSSFSQTFCRKISVSISFSHPLPLPHRYPPPPPPLRLTSNLVCITSRTSDRLAEFSTIKQVFS
eukprot:767986-Hanusia_phi.AAC.2